MLAQIGGNTALIPNGQALVAQQEAILTVLNDVWLQWIARKLEECGYTNGTKCSVNLTTGEVTLTDESPDR